jgi:hypothetical protein
VKRLAGAAAAIALSLALGGCAAPALLAGVSAAASIASAAHQFALVGGDIVAATALACQELPAATAAEQQRAAAPGTAAAPWYAALCGNLRPDNPNLNTGSPAWVAAGLARMEKP